MTSEQKSRLDTLTRTIIAATGGNQVLAQKTLIEKVLADDRLLRELVAPYLRGIALKKIAQISGAALPAPGAMQGAMQGAVRGPIRQVANLAPSPVSQPANAFPIGRPEIAAALSSGLVSGGKRGESAQKAGYNPMAARTAAEGTAFQRTEASMRHVNTMKMLADIYKAKRTENV